VKLNMRAYQDDLVEVEDVVEAQITESLMIAQHETVRYEHLRAKAELEFVIGAELEAALASHP
jgi:outer membrane protein